MFESAEQRHEMDKNTFNSEEPTLREGLLDAQADVAEKKAFPVLILLTGIDGAGKGEALGRLYEWLDPHTLHTMAFEKADDAERARPGMWRYWRELPPRGGIGVFVGSWYQAPLRARARGEIDDDGFAAEMAAIDRFERMLTEEGVLLLKFWLHLSGEERSRRRKTLRKNHGARHVVEHHAWKLDYEDAMAVIGTMARLTSTGHAPWIVVPSASSRYRDMTIGKTILAAVRKRLDAPVARPVANAPPVVAGIDGKTVLNCLDFSQKLGGSKYREELAHWQNRLGELTDASRFRDIAVAVVFEGNDAAGKGGSIRRVTMAIDPRRFRVYPIAAPTDEEKAQPYLWRFWRRLPAKGHVAIFDRSWYGRVLVERVEGFCTEADWLRAYNEIDDFEAQLDAAGTLVVKFWLAITSDEQLRRFQEREKTPYKRYKITAEDWRNRDKWDDYAQAVGDMVDRTSTEYAPWTLVAAEDKHFARVQVLRTLCERIEVRL